MNCKNCCTELTTGYKYCYECGAKVVNERITITYLIASLLITFGWDNRFFATFRDLVLKPQVIFEKYLNGTRKKYTNPFTYFAIGAALSVFIINLYSHELIEISTKANLKPSETLFDALPKDVNNSHSKDKADYMESQQSFIKKLIDFQYKYFYYLSFLLLPVYAFIAFLVFGKPDNYGEHLVINAYIQGLLFFFGLLLFFLTLLLRYDVISGGAIILNITYYSYAYKKYRNYSVGRTLKKLLKFIAILFIIALLLVGAGFFIGMFNGN